MPIPSMLNTVRAKGLITLFILISGLAVLVWAILSSAQKQNDFHNQLHHLQHSRNQLDSLNTLIQENISLLTQVVFQQKLTVASELLAKNENIISQFESFRSDARERGLEEDYNFAIENESLVLSLRNDFYTIVINARAKKLDLAQDQFFVLVDHRIRPILGFIRNAEILRDLRVRDAEHRLSELNSRLSQDITIIFIVIFIVSTIAITVLARSVSRPLYSMLSMINKITWSNDLKLRLEVENPDEFGKLAESFNAMVSELESSRSHTEKMNLDLKASAAQLADEVNNREQLIRKLEEKNSELERFTYTVSHDLKSPLVTIKGFIGLLKRDIKDANSERIENDLSNISAASDKMASLLEDLLELSRVGRVASNPEKISLNELFEEAAFLVNGQVEESNARINIAANMPSIYADRHSMTEVAQNLLDNAIKFRSADVEPVIEIEASCEKSQIVCRVRDNGIGIDPKYQDKIFGLFDRLDLSLEGTGIGLALVHRIIELHDGKLSVESDGEGSGSTFIFSLPELESKAVSS